MKISIENESLQLKIISVGVWLCCNNRNIHIYCQPYLCIYYFGISHHLVIRFTNILHIFLTVNSVYLQCQQIFVSICACVLRTGVDIDSVCMNVYLFILPTCAVLILLTFSTPNRYASTLILLKSYLLFLRKLSLHIVNK